MKLEQRPGNHECFDYHRNYVSLVPDGSILETLEEQLDTATDFIRRIDEAQLTVVHPPYGWQIRTVLEHCCDTERVFGYRALRFATGDKTDLPGWDENQYAACGYGANATGAELGEEFSALRVANIRLFRRLRSQAWDEIGTADGRQVSVRTLAWLLAGHWLHHQAILAKRLGWTDAG